MPWGGQAQPKGRQAGRVWPGTCSNLRAAGTERDLIPRPCRAGRMGPTPQGPPRGEETHPRPHPHPALVTRPPLLPGGQAPGPRVLTQMAQRGSRGWTQWALETGRRAVPGPASRGTGLVWSASWRAGRGAWAEGGRGGLGGQARTIVVAALCPLAKQEVPGLSLRAAGQAPRVSGNPLPTGSGRRNAPSPGPGLVWPPSAPPEARHTLPGQGQPTSWRKLPWALPAARAGGGLRPGCTGGPHWGWREREPGDRVPGLPQLASPSRGLWAPLKPGPLAPDLHLFTGPLDPLG